MADIVEVKEQEYLPADPMIAMIERVAMDANSDPAKLAQMLDLKAKHEAQEAKKAFDRAFAAASAEFPDIPKNGRNTHNGQYYALLKDILSATRPVLSKHGFALSFSTDAGNGQVVVTAELSHEGGHSKKNSLPLPVDTGPGRNAAQAVGSSQTYGQRYTAQAILGLSLGEDTEDDGNGAGKREEFPKKQNPTWENTVLQDLPKNSTPRDKAKALTKAICLQWKRMKGVQQIDNEWDRRAGIIAKLEQHDRDLFQTVIDAYDARRAELDGSAVEGSND